MPQIPLAAITAFSSPEELGGVIIGIVDTDLPAKTEDTITDLAQSAVTQINVKVEICRITMTFYVSPSLIRHW